MLPQTHITPQTSLTPASPWLRAMPFMAILAVYLLGYQIHLMDVDAAQYAAISREMVQKSSYLQVEDRGRQYLDKPPLLFWLAAASYQLFGVSDAAFRLPSLLFAILAIYSVYRLARLYYSFDTAYVAALVTASCQAFFLINHDVRTDTILTGATTFALWQITAFLKGGGITNVVLGAIGVAGAMLCKGPIGIMVPVLAFGCDWVAKGQLKNFLKWQWLLALVIIGVLLVPMSIGLYNQHGFKGLRFFYWTQSFGRLTGESEWNNHAGPFFLSHNFLWAFLPWPLLFLYGLGRAISQLWKQRFRISNEQEIISLAGFVFPFMAFSASKYQLPHYMFVVFPLAAIITAKGIVHLAARGSLLTRRLARVQFGIGIGLFIVLGLLLCICFPLQNGLVALGIGIAAIVSWMLFMRNALKMNYGLGYLFMPSVAMIIAVNIGLNGWVYPTLLHYQSGSQLAFWLNKHHISGYKVTGVGIDSYAFDVYTQTIGLREDDTTNLPKYTRLKGHYLWARERDLPMLQRAGIHYKEVKAFDEYHVTMLTLPFLNPATRPKKLEKRWLVQII